MRNCNMRLHYARNYFSLYLVYSIPTDLSTVKEGAVSSSIDLRYENIILHESCKLNEIDLSTFQWYFYIATLT